MFWGPRCSKTLLLPTRCLWRLEGEQLFYIVKAEQGLVDAFNAKHSSAVTIDKKGGSGLPWSLVGDAASTWQAAMTIAGELAM